MLLFDLDGTLLDSNGIWREVDETFLARRKMEYSREYYNGVAHTALPEAAVFTKAFCKLDESCEEIIREWMELAKDMYAHVKPKPGVQAYLEQCRRRGEKMAIVTNCVPAHCITALQQLGWKPFFQQILYAQELPFDKKSPELWKYAAKSLSVKESDCTVFDDSSASCSAAFQAGMTVFGVYDTFFSADEEAMKAVCHRYIRNFEELLNRD